MVLKVRKRNCQQVKIKVQMVSQGGFSNIFTEGQGFNLTYQQSTVQSWRKQKPRSSLSLPGYTLPNGEVGVAFPDVSAKSDNIIAFAGNYPAIRGITSAVTPRIFAGIVKLCPLQLRDDETRFGWINLILYKNPELFFDIQGGNNQYIADIWCKIS